MPFLCASLIAILIAPAAFACVCPGIPNTEESRRKAVAIVEGVVVEKRVVVSEEWDGWFTPTTEYDFAVVHVWKGEARRQLTLIGGLGGCSRHFAPGRRYVVYAVSGSERGSLTDLACGTTHRVRPEREPPVAYMGAPLATFEEPARDALPPASPSMWYARRAYVAAGAAVFANLVRHGAETGNRVATAPLAIVISGSLLVLVPLVGVACSFGKARRAIVLLVVAGMLIVIAFGAAGRLLIAHPRERGDLVWPLTYMVPDEVDP
jgi:hypothetical protein